jgi:hypothetical protein
MAGKNGAAAATHDPDFSPCRLIEDEPETAAQEGDQAGPAASSWPSFFLTGAMTTFL